MIGGQAQPAEQSRGAAPMASAAPLASKLLQDHGADAPSRGAGSSRGPGSPLPAAEGPPHATITAAAMAAAALRAGSGPVSGRSTTWPKVQAQPARPEPSPATRSGEWAKTPRQRTYLVGLAASVLLLMIGRSVLQADTTTPDELALAQNSAEAPAVPGSTTGLGASGATGEIKATTHGERSSTSPVPPDNGDKRPPHQPDPAASTSGAEAGETGSTSIMPTLATGPAIETPRPPRLATLIDDGCREVRLGDARRGVEQLRAAYDRAPGELQVLWCLADGYAKLGKYESALRYYNDLLEESPRHTKALRGAAQANEYLDRRAAASEMYRRLLISEPDSPSALAFFAAEEKRRKSP